MEKSESEIEIAFKQKIGIDLDKAIDILNKEGITPEDLGEITNILKGFISEEIDKRKIPYEYRFLMLNVILCTMFEATADFYKKFETILRDMDEKDMDERDVKRSLREDG